jgi:single-strand DNA-binding protein
MNKQAIIGNLTGDPEVRQVGDKQVCEFSVAVNGKFNDKDGNRTTTFYRVSAWRGLGENCAKFLSKGKKVYVSGEPKARLFDKDGEKRLSLEITANEVEFLSPNNAIDDTEIV